VIRLTFAIYLWYNVPGRKIYGVNVLFVCGQGRPFPPEAMMHFPLFQISPYFRQIFRLCGKFSKFYLSPEKFVRFPSAKISDDLAFLSGCAPNN